MAVHIKVYLLVAVLIHIFSRSQIRRRLDHGFWHHYGLVGAHPLLDVY